jgi:hypothetical protein
MEELKQKIPGLMSQEDFAHVREEFEKAVKVEWTEEREELERDEFFGGRIKKIMEQKRRGAQAM